MCVLVCLAKIRNRKKCWPKNIINIKYTAHHSPKNIINIKNTAHLSFSFSFKKVGTQSLVAEENMFGIISITRSPTLKRKNVAAALRYDSTFFHHSTPACNEVSKVLTAEDELAQQHQHLATNSGSGNLSSTFSQASSFDDNNFSTAFWSAPNSSTSLQSVPPIYYKSESSLFRDF